MLQSPSEALGRVTSPRQYLELEQQWLQRVGWERNPFSKTDAPAEPLTQAEDESDDVDRWYSDRSPVTPDKQRWISAAEPSGDDRDFFDDLSAANHALVWGRMGSGKSATRLLLRTSLVRRGVLVSEYLGRLMLDQQTNHSFLDRMIGLVMRATLHLLPSDLPASRLLTTGSDPIQSLSNIVAAVVECTKQPVFILIDDVDVYRSDNHELAEIIHQRIHPFLQPRVLEIPNLCLKMFLPHEAQTKLQNLPSLQRFFETDRVRSFGLSWTTSTLLSLLNRRLKLVSNAESLDEISSDEIGLPFALEQQMVAIALEQSGPPRALLRLAFYLITEHIKSDDFYTDREKYRLTSRDMKNACAAIGVHLGPKPISLR